jgi:hypothetical protein
LFIQSVTIELIFYSADIIIEFKDLLRNHSSFSSDIVAAGPVLRHYADKEKHP